ncbi:MAG: YbjQ family protein [Micromonosporaceae bacterium]
MEVQCPECLLISTVADLGAASWDCACGCSYSLRRCSACGVVSHVSSLQRNGEPWNCTWCKAANAGYARRNDPATATLSDLGADMARHGLRFARRTHSEPIRDTQPMLIVTTNEVPGHRIVGVQGDVFGVIVRARNYFSNLGAQFRTLAGGEVAGYTRLLVDSRNQARERMWREARARGANAVVAMRFDCNEIGDIMSEVAAYGTAVTVESLDPEPASREPAGRHTSV